MKKKYICAECKKESLHKDAFLEWSVRDQEWILEIAGDEFFCCNCQNNVDAEEIEIPD